MAHKVIDETPWYDNIAQRNSNGWSLQLGSATVTQLRLDDGFVIHLDNEIDIVVDEMFKLRKDDQVFQVYLTEAAHGVMASQLIRQPVRETLVTLEGTLEIIFKKESSEELALVVRSPNWRICFPDGSTCWGLLEGGIGLFPPERSRGERQADLTFFAISLVT